MNIVLKKLHLDGGEFITSEEVRRVCAQMGADYYATIRYLTFKRYLIRIFKGVFHVRNFEDMKLGRTRYNHLDLVARGLEIKGVANWYFGLRTALKLNNATHEHFTMDYVVSDTLFRHLPITVNGYRFRFVKLAGRFTGFGIISDRYRYSDLEKTILDMMYLARYASTPRERILRDISDYTNGINRERLAEYAGRYPKSVGSLADDLA